MEVIVLLVFILSTYSECILFIQDFDEKIKTHTQHI